MKLFVTLIICAIFISGCSGTAQSNSSGNPDPKTALGPLPDDIGPVLQCNKCAFVEEQGIRYIAGEINNGAKQAVTGYVMAIDLQDEKGQSVKKIAGLMLMEAMSLQPGETKKFKERVLSSEANVTQASVYFKKAGRDVKLSNPLVLKLQR
ncbi:MAG TPA: hypothetical protein VGO56_08260 [Pyrinomonadaceae bacterium]|jgi:hypothetical protein|nr:hypothetical protein [Pyrinomonadaceae bacterium]